MRISGNEPSSVILRQIVVLKVENVDPKLPKEAEAKRDGVINPQNYNFNQFLNGEFRCSQTLRINRSRPNNLATCALGDSLVHMQ